MDVEIEAKARNQYVKVQGEFAMEIMHEFVNDPDWDSYPPIQKKLLLDLKHASISFSFCSKFSQFLKMKKIALRINGSPPV